jgi:hypothetical protein
LSLLSTFSVSFVSLIVLHGRRRRRRMRISLLLLRIVMHWLLLFQNLQWEPTVMYWPCSGTHGEFLLLLLLPCILLLRIDVLQWRQIDGGA